MIIIILNKLLCWSRWNSYQINSTVHHSQTYNETWRSHARSIHRLCSSLVLNECQIMLMKSVVLAITPQVTSKIFFSCVDYSSSTSSSPQYQFNSLPGSFNWIIFLSSFKLDKQNNFANIPTLKLFFTSHDLKIVLIHLRVIETRKCIMKVNRVDMSFIDRQSRTWTNVVATFTPV